MLARAKQQNVSGLCGPIDDLNSLSGKAFGVIYRGTENKHVRFPYNNVEARHASWMTWK